MIETARQRMTKGMSLLSDEPASSNIFFNFKEYAEQVLGLLSDKTVSPFTIAIHGEWGSGKTTLLEIIRQDLECRKSLKIIKFNAWEYERTDVVASLLQHIERKIREDNNTERTDELTRHIASLAVDVLLRKTIGLSKKDVEAHFSSRYDATESIKRTLERVMGETRMVILIDDLDRCLADNVLNLLEAIKMFLNIKNLIIVMAIDITKIERAWELRYGARAEKIEGREHVEKMFQLKLALPPKSREDMLGYIKHHAGSLTTTNAEFILDNSQFNPRKVKRMLNLLYVLLQNLPDRGDMPDRIDDNFKVDSRILISWAALTLNHPDMARKIQEEPDLLIRTAVICNRVKSYDRLRSLLDDIDRKNHGVNVWRNHEIKIEQDVLTANVHSFLNDIVAEPTSFKIISHFADQFGLNKRTEGNVFLMSKSRMKGIDSKFRPLLCDIIERAGLVGV